MVEESGYGVNRKRVRRLMGSKKLKAIVTCQGSHAVQVAHRLKLHKLVDTLVNRMKAWPGRTRVEDGGFNVGRFTRYREDCTSLSDSVGLCNRAFINRFYHIDTTTELYNAITGLNMKPADMMKAAERSWNLWRLLNNKAGFSRKNDCAPAMWFAPLATKGSADLFSCLVANNAHVHDRFPRSLSRT